MPIVFSGSMIILETNREINTCLRFDLKAFLEQERSMVMDFVLGQLRQLAMVLVIMGCALVGTAGLMKLIRRFAGGRDLSLDSIIKKMEDGRKEGE